MPAMIPVRSRRSEEHTSELQSHVNLVCRLLLEKKKKIKREDIKYIIKKRLVKIINVILSTYYYLHVFICLSIRFSNTLYVFLSIFFFFNDTATTEIYTLSLHDALPISGRRHRLQILAHQFLHLPRDVR